MLVAPMLVAVVPVTAAMAAGPNRLSDRMQAHTSAPGASAWDVSLTSRLRLIAAQTGLPPHADAAVLEAGIEIALDPNWKTYWRSPGDSGIAPHFDFSQSVNVATVEVAYPMPHRFDQPGDISFGYKTQVIFPLRVTPVDPAAPVVLVADVIYGACEELCIPVEAHARLEFTPGAVSTTAFAPQIARWRAWVPAAHAARVESVRPVAGDDGPGLRVVIIAPEQLINPVLIAEPVAGKARVYLGTPRIVSAGNRAEFTFPVRQRMGSPGLNAGLTLALTFADMPKTPAGTADAPVIWAQQFEYELAPQ